MDVPSPQNRECSCSDKDNQTAKPRKRGIKNLTSLSLGWLAEKMRRAEKLKEQIASGSYRVDSEKLAGAIANEEPEDK